MQRSAIIFVVILMTFRGYESSENVTGNKKTEKDISKRTGAAYPAATGNQAQTSRNNEHILTQRDSSGHPYAFVQPAAETQTHQQHQNYQYHQQYYDKHAVQPQYAAEFSTRQGFGGAMEDVFGPDAGLILGTLGAITGVLAMVGVAWNNVNVHDLSEDQTSMCSAAKNLGSTTFSEVSSTCASACIRTAYNTLIGQLNAIATPDCN